MTKTGKRILYGVLAVLIVAIIGFAVYLNSLLPIITGYAAKNLCSDVFVSNRKPADVEAIDLNFSFIKYTKNIVNYDEKSVTSHFLWGKSKAIYREGFGATLLKGITEDKLMETKFPRDTEPEYSQDTIAWPFGDILPKRNTGIDTIELDKITEKLITNNAYNGNAFAFIVLHNGVPVAEAYKQQFTQKTRFLSWSMAKSFVNAMVGILVKEGKMDIRKSVGIDEWKDDSHVNISIKDLMQMQSGLKWNEDYGNRSDVTLMLHKERDMGHFALNRPTEYTAGSHWYYSSGSTNIVSYLIRKQFGNDSAYYSFAKSRLFNKTGMPDAVFEVDASGTIVGSSYLYATARDYARFGLLYQNDGVFNGERILPEGWVKFTTTPASDSKDGYGAFFWLNSGYKLPSAPGDMYSCDGHDGQHIYILPHHALIVVVLGYSPTSKGGMDTNRLLKDIVSTVE
jgi:hypothetical protein